VCVSFLQETRLDVIDDFIVMECLGPSFDGYVYLLAVETRGEVLLAWNKSVLDVARVSFDTHAITGKYSQR
jgi:hypothetical protein